MSPSDKSDRDAVLARRRLFVASAMASIAVTQTRCDNPFRPCLSPAVRADAEPMVCLSAPPDFDASVSITTDAGSDASADTEPQPCLSVAQPPPDGGRDAATKPPPRPCLSPPPQVCLSPVRPQPCLKPSSGGGL